MKQVTIVAKLNAKKGKEKEMKAALEVLIKKTLIEDGCIDCTLHTTPENETAFLFYENWMNQKEWEKHMGTNHVKAFLGKADYLLDGEVDLSQWNVA